MVRRYSQNNDWHAIPVTINHQTVVKLSWKTQFHARLTRKTINALSIKPVNMNSFRLFYNFCHVREFIDIFPSFQFLSLAYFFFQFLFFSWKILSFYLSTPLIHCFFVYTSSILLLLAFLFSIGYFPQFAHSCRAKISIIRIFISILEKTFERGCLSDSGLKCSNVTHCYLCTGQGCNSENGESSKIPIAPSSASMLKTSLAVVSFITCIISIKAFY